MCVLLWVKGQEGGGCRRTMTSAGRSPLIESNWKTLKNTHKGQTFIFNFYLKTVSETLKIFLSSCYPDGS